MKISSIAVAVCSLLVRVSLDNNGVSAKEIVCGAFCDIEPQDAYKLEKCLRQSFGDKNVTGSTEGGPHRKLAFMPELPLYFTPDSKITFDDDTLFYLKAKSSSSGKRIPRAIVFAENSMDVVNATNCAREAGYKVTARGRGHSFDGWGSADGAVVIDMQYTCDVTKMIESIDRSQRGPHLIPGTNYIATIKAQAGCSNINWLAAVYKGFGKEEGAIASIGSCPSVGIVGYSLGGGLGDTSPITGYALDLVTEYEMVLHDGSIVTASENQNEDLYWANRGGGGGNGVITSLTFKVVQSPTPEAFTHFVVRVQQEHSEWFVLFQNFLYDNAESYRFGGNANYFGAGFVCLGTAEECVQIITDAGLMDQSLFSRPGESSSELHFTRDYEDICGPEDEVPSCQGPINSFLGSHITQFRTQGEVLAFITCKESLDESFALFGFTARSTDICADLGINDEHCTEENIHGFNGIKDCSKKDVIDAILEKGSDSRSFISRHGRDVNAELAIPMWGPGIVTSATGKAGGFVLPRLEDDTIRKIFSINPLAAIANHLVHGASHMVAKDATAMPWRNAVFNTGVRFADNKDVIDILLRDKSIRSDPTKIQGYYSYIGPASLPNWERFYFGDNVSRLQEIKSQWDPTGLFDKPMQISGTNTDLSTDGRSSKKGSKGNLSEKLSKKVSKSKKEKGPKERN